MNYDDELERSRARRSRKRETVSNVRGSRGSASSDSWTAHAEPGSRASRSRGASHGSNHRRRRGPGKKKKIIIGILLALLFVIAAAAVGAYAYLNHHIGKAQKGDFERSEVTNINIPEATREKMEKGYWTIAVFGLDSRDSSTGAGNQSDVIMIANVDRKTGEIKLASVFRDTYLNVNERNSYNKINAAYAEGGAKQALKALNKNLDLNITHYVSFNWGAVATGINILGGVDIDISKSEFYYINAFITETVKGTGIGSVQLKKPGLHHLDGVQAVAYGRLRLMDSDYARVERQRIVIKQAFEQAKKADIATLNNLVTKMSEMCETNIDTNEVLAMAANITKYHLGETMGFPAARGEARVKIGKNNLSCVIPQTLVSNVSSLHNFLFGEEDYVPSSTVQSISNKIAEVSGLYKEGKEIGHVATDKGYIPKATTAAAEKETKETKETEETSPEETKEGESGSGAETSSGETSEGETIEGESSESGAHAGGWETSSSAGQTGPGGWEGTGPGHTGETERPSSPLDLRPTEEPYGPGYATEEPEEATKELPGPDSMRPTSPSGAENQPSVIIVEPTASQNGPAGPASSQPTSPAAPSSPADMNSPASGNTTGPASATAPSQNSPAAHP